MLNKIDKAILIVLNKSTYPGLLAKINYILNSKGLQVCALDLSLSQTRLEHNEE